MDSVYIRPSSDLDPNELVSTTTLAKDLDSDSDSDSDSKTKTMKI